jgi:hypothetical protein
MASGRVIVGDKSALGTIRHTSSSKLIGMRTFRRHGQLPLLRSTYRAEPVPLKCCDQPARYETKRSQPAVPHAPMFQKCTHTIQQQPMQSSATSPLTLPFPLVPKYNGMSTTSLHRDPTPASHSQRHPPTNQRHTTQRRNRPHNLEPLRIQHKQINRTAKHRHARRQQRFRPDFLLAGESCLDGYQGDGVDELGGMLRSRSCLKSDDGQILDVYLIVSRRTPTGDFGV